MRVFVGEPGYEYKENFRTLSNAALSGGVTSVVTMPNTKPVIDSVSIVDFIQRRGRDKSKINIFPTATLTKDTEGMNMCEFGLLKNKGIVGFTDGVRSIKSPRVMSRIIKSAYDFDCLVIQHAADQELSKDGMINDGIISVASVASLAQGDDIQIGTEVMHVNRVVGSTLHVSRGWNNTTIAGHQNGAAILKIDEDDAALLDSSDDFGFGELYSDFTDMQKRNPISGADEAI